MAFFPILKIRPPPASLHVEVVDKKKTKIDVPKIYRKQRVLNRVSVNAALNQPVLKAMAQVSPDVLIDVRPDARPDAPPEVSKSRLDLDAIRRNFQQSEKVRRMDLTERSQLAEKDKTPEIKLQKDLEKSLREDCMMARPDGAKIGNVTFKGILTFAPILLDTIKGKGCKW